MKVPVTIYAEMTPNPKAMKFVANIALVTVDEAYEYISVDECESSPLAKVLFTFPFVSSVMISQNFVTISIIDKLEWDDVVLEVRNYLTNYIQAGQPIFTLTANPPKKKEEEVKEKRLNTLPKPGEVRDIDAKIEHILQEYVRPAIESDGGAIRFESYEDGELKVKLSGACNGCPSATQTLQHGVQSIFEKLLPQIKTVTSI